MSAAVRIRPAERADVPLILDLIRALAEYERAPDKAIGTAEALEEHVFGERPAAEVLIAETGGEAVGFALFFTTFSTWLCRPGLWLEDLFVLPAHRAAGVGRALLERLAQLAIERGCARMEWVALDWNEPALGFYARLGARPLDDWVVLRIDGDALSELATAGGPARP